MVAASKEEELDSPDPVFVAVPPPTPPLLPAARVGESGSENREGSGIETAFAIRNFYADLAFGTRRKQRSVVEAVYTGPSRSRKSRS